MHGYFDFTVSLRDVLPRPWRRFQLRGTGTFAALSDAIRDACGWAGSHLYEFIETDPYGGAVPLAGLVTGEGRDDERPVADAKRTRLSRYFGPEGRTSCLYLYDFGDDWTHDVQLNEIVTRPERFAQRLVDGAHPFPPDDCGGALGYGELQRALQTGRDPEGLIEWARDVWAWTGEFDLASVRKQFDR